MTTLTVRLPVRLREKLARISGGKSADWVCDRIEKALALYDDERIKAANAEVTGGALAARPVD